MIQTEERTTREFAGRRGDNVDYKKMTFNILVKSILQIHDHTAAQADGGIRGRTWGKKDGFKGNEDFSSPQRCSVKN